MYLVIAGMAEALNLDFIDSIIILKDCISMLQLGNLVSSSDHSISTALQFDLDDFTDKANDRIPGQLFHESKVITGFS